MTSESHNLIDTLLSKIQSHPNEPNNTLWSKPHLIRTAKVSFGLLLSVAIWYLLLVQSYSVFLGLNTNSVLWKTYPIFHILAASCLLLATLFVAHLSPRAQAQNKFGLVAIALFGSFFIILISPTGWAWVPLLLLGITAFAYWLTPWAAIQQQLRPINKRSDQATIENTGEEQRYHQAAIRVDALIVNQMAEFKDTNFNQDPQRYEYDLENKLNLAALKRVDQIEGLFSEILKELKNDIETANLDLQDFINHLGYKFGALIYSMNACFENDVFEWFLQTAHNQTSLLESDEIKTNYAAMIMLQNTRFHISMLKGDSAAAFKALNQLFILHSVRYPLNKEATEASIVSCMEILSQTEQPAENIQDFFDALASLPNDYPSFYPADQAELQEIIKLAIAKYNLIDNPQLTNSQKALLTQFMVNLEDL